MATKELSLQNRIAMVSSGLRGSARRLRQAAQSLKELELPFGDSKILKGIFELHISTIEAEAKTLSEEE